MFRTWRSMAWQVVVLTPQPFQVHWKTVHITCNNKNITFYLNAPKAMCKHFYLRVTFLKLKGLSAAPYVCALVCVTPKYKNRKRKEN